MERKRWNRILALLVAISLLATNVNFTLFAEAQSGDEFSLFTDSSNETLYFEAPVEEPAAEEEPGAGTEPTEQPEESAEQPVEPEIAEPAETPETPVPVETPVPSDLTGQTEQLALSLSGWWYGDRENTASLIQTAEDGKYVDFSAIQVEDGIQDEAGFRLCYQAFDIHAGDYFEVLLPAGFQSIALSDGFSPDGITCEMTTADESSTRLRVSFLADGKRSGELPLTFYFGSEAPVSLSLQDASEGNSYIVIPPSVTWSEEEQSIVLFSNRTEESGETEGAGEQAEANGLEEQQRDIKNRLASVDTFLVRGEIQFSDTLNGKDWSGLLRPLEFDQKIRLTAYYNDGATEKTEEFYAQEDLSTGAFYLMMTHDGSGGGSFVVDNVPKQIEVDGETKTVTKYTVTIASELPYYTCNSFDINDMEASQNVSTLTMSVQSQTMTLSPSVYPDSATSEIFEMDLTFTNNSSNKVKTAAGTGTLSVHAPNQAVVYVPVGLEYTVTQKDKEGYQLSEEYRITKKTGEQESETTQTNSASGTIEAGTNVTIATTNYAKNLSYPITVKWVDQNSPDRPTTLSESNFRLMYQKEGSTEWTELTEENMSDLGLTAMPSFDTDYASENKYFFRGLPGTAADGKSVSYRVEVKAPPASYTASANDNYHEFTFRKTMTFQADINWLDSHNADSTRPNSLPLKLYRKVENGSYEEVPLPDEAITKSVDTWQVRVKNLLRYNDDGQEYDYVLVQGTIDSNDVIHQTDVTDYRTYYHNGQGNYGNDLALCHNGGQITEKIYMTTDFTATKSWKDGGDAPSPSPKATVTLWRYSVPEGSAANTATIDSMYNSGQAARVIYHWSETNGEEKGILLSYEIDKTDSETTILFNNSTIPGLPADFALPAYDENGRKYVYFVRETMDTEDYETVYSGGNRQGTLNNGTITNVRREKAEIIVNKVWQCPSNLNDIEDVSVQVKIKAPLKGSTENPPVYKDTTVYSSDPGSYEVLTGENEINATKLSGFSANIASLDLHFFVNTYDEDGNPLDMTRAVIEEVKLIRTDANGNEVEIVPSNNSFTLNGNTYSVKSTYVPDESKADPSDGSMKEYKYRLKNTISGTRSYTLIKKWQGIDASDYEDIQYVNFKLYRRSSKDGGVKELYVDSSNTNCDSVNGIWKLPKGTGTEWSIDLEGLPKYDAEGYAYLYEAEEVSVTKTVGTIIPISEKGWAVYHYRTDDSTTAVNHLAREGGQNFSISKNWYDNGDTANRKPVTVRIYRKADIQTALNGKADTDIISLDDTSLTGIKYASYTLNSSNNWNTRPALSNVETIIGVSNTFLSDYLILEYLVGAATEADNATTAKYTCGALKNAAGTATTYSLSGTAGNKYARYRVDIASQNGNREIDLTNTRIGEVDISITKKWHDEQNASNKRPNQIQFQIYQDGKVYVPGADNGITVSTSTSDESDTGLTKDLGDTTGVLTLTYTDGGNNKASDWYVTLQDLPLYSYAGVPHTYHIEEIGTISDYSSEKGAINITEDTTIPGHVSSSFSFVNTIQGTTSHTAYKYWRDAAADSSDRPDLYLTLYCYLKSDADSNPNTDLKDLHSYKEFTDYKDQIWTQGAKMEAEPWDWKITVSDLPQYDSNGRKYVYVFEETMNNGGVTVWGTYRQTKTTDNGQDVFTNTLTDRMKITGLKLWTGLGSYQVTQDDLPSPTIELYRALSEVDLQGKSDDEINQLIEVGEIARVNTTSLDTAKSGYAFPDVSKMTDEEKTNAVNRHLLMKVDGEGEEEPKYYLPKYDDYGSRYVYLIREKLVGTADSLYTKLSSNNTLTNTFRSDVNRRIIKVTKTWAGRANLRENEKKYPSVTYELYRYIQGEVGSDVLLKTATINASDFAASSDGSYTYSFTDLLIYSPSGKKYGYYIKEKSINGYTISYQDEADIQSGYEGNSQCDIISIPENALTSNDHTVAVGTTNTYDNPGKITISGSKLWNDYGNSNLIYGNRPDTITVRLKRYTQNESGQVNEIESGEITLSTESGEITEKTDPYIVWKTSDTGNDDLWTYTIYNLERYAPNGMPYIYTVTEDAVDGYKQSSQIVKKESGNDSGIYMSQLTNSLGFSYYVRKNWMDGDNRYNLRPENVTIVLQRKKDNDSTWEYIEWKPEFGQKDTSGKWTGLPSDVEISGKPVVSICLTSKYLIPNTKGNSWEFTFTNLPEYAVDGSKWTYRCVETKIGAATIPEDMYVTDTYTAGAYTRTYTEMSDTKTVIQNKLESTSLYVEKVWEGDHNDQYHTRPESLTFVLQMRGIEKNSTGGSTASNGTLTEWTDVKKADDASYTFTITKAMGWKTTLEDLPVATVGEDGVTYYNLYFRAVEQHESDSSNRVSGALNYTDITSYEKDSTDHIYDGGLSRNQSTITNKLIPADTASITVHKTWYRESGTEKQAVFELLYRQTGQTGWHCFKDEDSCQNGSASGCRTSHTTESGCVQKTLTSTDAGSASFNWDGLPKCNRQGHELEYQVVEHPVSGYNTESTSTKPDNSLYANEYAFTNIELQDYTVTKKWITEDYAQKNGTKYTATFKLQKKEGDDGEWTDVTGSEQTLEAAAKTDTPSYTWTNLPKYTNGGREITYRAVETKINGLDVTGNTNGAYIVTYQYRDKNAAEQDDPGFAGTETIATNRMVYGFVNLNKSAAYLNKDASPLVTADGTKSLRDVVFDLYSGTGESKTRYASGIRTDTNGNLIHDQGKYGTEGKYLVSGTYTLVEKSTSPGYGIWKDGVEFTVGINGGPTNTGEHGTAWISTTAENNRLSSKVTYLSPSNTGHTVGDNCEPTSGTDSAYNVESRGVISFTKTGPGPDSNGSYKELDVHAGASGESAAYFGVYTNEACTEQVAGMKAAADDRKKMVLTTQAENGTDNQAGFTEIKNPDGIPYLRVASDGFLSLLSGTYYIRELIAPPGYRLDNTVRKAVIPEIPKIDFESDLSSVYENNLAEIMLIGEISGVTAYQWANTENRLTLYKKDQFGRTVDLGTDGYLELSVEGAGNTFLTGENPIRLYQDSASPAKKADGTAFDEGHKPDITYDTTKGCWTITALFDIGKTYKLSEPDSSVPVNNIQAKEIRFRMLAGGSIEVIAFDPPAADDPEPQGDPLQVKGDDYNSYYKADPDHNVVVMRDVARYRSDVVLEKIDSKTNGKIAYISFTLYQYDSIDTNGNVVNPVSVLGAGTYLTTGSDGKIQLSALPDSIINKITGCALCYGLDVGKYYFQEAERGASDSYRLADPIFFEITPKAPGSLTDPQDYAEVTFSIVSDVVSQSGSTGTVKNTPVTEKAKTLQLTKVDSKNGSTNLEGAKFTLTYTSATAGTDGSKETVIDHCITRNDGVLYLTDAGGNATSQKPDISRKGTYVLVETQAPEKYMTPTDASGNPTLRIRFQVDSENKITILENSRTDLVTAAVISASGEDTGLQLTVKNEKTIVSVSKRNDIKDSLKTDGLNGEPLAGAELEIYEGTEATGTPVPTWTSSATALTLTGELKENTIYTIHEKKAPVGYLKASDIRFKLFGTIVEGGQTRSHLYVWNGTGTPALEGEGWSEVISIQDAVLTMVDETILAPVDLQKVVGSTGSLKVLPNAVFKVKSLDDTDNSILGTAVTNENGYLVWQSVEASAYAKWLIFNKNRKRISSDDSVIGETILLRQNTNGYSFTETYAPDYAYNEGKSFTVKITEKNYTDYRDSGYQENVYVNILSANESNGHQVENLTTRNDTDRNATESDLVNPSFVAYFELYKYDAEHPAINSNHDNYETIGLSGVGFTLYRKETDGSYGEAVSCTSGVDGLLKITLTKKGTYKLVETSPLPGYEKNLEEMIFTVNNDDYKKTLTYKYVSDNSNNTVVLRDENNNSVGSEKAYDLPNQRKHGTVCLTKKDGDSDVLLNGVQFTLKRTDPAVNSVDKWFPSSGNNSLTVETGKTYGKIASAENETEFNDSITDGTTGVLTLQDLQWGTYQLQEVREADGYILSGKTYEFTVNAENVHLTQPVKDGDEEFVGNTKNQLTVKKTNSSGDALTGAKFQLYPVTRDATNNEVMETTAVNFYTAADSQTKNADTLTAGETTIYGLSKGTYVLREIKAPDSYELTRDIIFTMKEDGNVYDVTTCSVDESKKITRDAPGDNVVTISTYVTGTTVSNVFSVKDTPIELFIKKTDENSTKLLSGAEFVLTDACGADNHKLADGSDNAAVVTGNVGSVMIPIGLVIAGHTYTLAETKAPDGYECTAKVTFTVKTDGTIENLQSEGGYKGSGGTDSCASLDGNKTTISIRNEKVGLSLTKVDSDDTSKKLGGVTFTLQCANGSSFVSPYIVSGISNVTYDGASNTYSLTTDSDGKIFIPDGLLIHDHSYILTETDLGGHINYRLSDEPKDRQIAFRVEKDGTITITSSNNLFRVNAGTEIVVSNQEISLTITKVDQATGAPLQGVTLKLSKKNANTWQPYYMSGVTDTDGTWTTSDNGKVTFRGIDFLPGIYKLEEISGPSEYNSIAEALVFEIGQNGRIKKVNESTDVIGDSWTYHNFKIDNPEDGKAGGISLTVSNAAYSDLQITKKGSDGLLLSDVELQLEYWDRTNANWKYVKLNSTGKAEVSGKTLAEGTATEAKMTTGNSGIVCFSGLPDGKYRISEVKTAAGYNLLSTKLVVEINRNAETYTVTSDPAGSRSETLQRNGNTILMDVINQKGQVLPATGTKTPQLPKAVLVLTALLEGLVLYLYQRRSKRRKKEAGG